MSPWVVYVLLSNDRRRTYVGITNNLERRIAQHNGEQPGGAKATRPGRPWTIGVVFEDLDGRAEASALEYRVKQLRGSRRLFDPRTQR